MTLFFPKVKSSRECAELAKIAEKTADDDDGSRKRTIMKVGPRFFSISLTHRDIFKWRQQSVLRVRARLFFDTLMPINWNMINIQLALLFTYVALKTFV